MKEYRRYGVPKGWESDNSGGQKIEEITTQGPHESIQGVKFKNVFREIIS